MANAKKKPAVFLESFCGLYPAEAISFRLGGAAEGGASVLRHKIRAAHGAAALGKGAAVFLFQLQRHFSLRHEFSCERAEKCFESVD